MTDTREFEHLFSRLDDLSVTARSGAVSRTDFLSPRELHYAERYLSERRIGYVTYGGYEGAERKRIYVLPDYMEDVTSVTELLDYGTELSVSVLRIKGSGYRELSHRDFLGSTLGLGIERSVLGDIIADEDRHGAYMFCDSSIAVFLTLELEKVANDKVKVTVGELPEGFEPCRPTTPINDTVPSPRLDCVVGALLSLSREKAKAAVSDGLCEVDFELEEKCDRQLSAPCLISVRGYGRYRVLSLEDKTKKGRIRLVAEKFV